MFNVALGRTSCLLPCNGCLLRWCPFHFLTLLDQGADGAEEVHQTVTAKSSIDAFAFPDLATDLGPGPDTDRAQDGQDPVHDAAFSDRLGIFTGREAGHEISDDAEAAVVEAAEETVLPLCHSD